MIRESTAHLECASCDEALEHFVRDVDQRLGVNRVVNDVGVDASARGRVSR